MLKTVSWADESNHVTEIERVHYYGDVDRAIEATLSGIPFHAELLNLRWYCHAWCQCMLAEAPMHAFAVFQALYDDLIKKHPIPYLHVSVLCELVCALNISCKRVPEQERQAAENPSVCESVHVPRISRVECVKILKPGVSPPIRISRNQWVIQGEEDGCVVYWHGQGGITSAFVDPLKCKESRFHEGLSILQWLLENENPPYERYCANASLIQAVKLLSDRPEHDVGGVDMDVWVLELFERRQLDALCHAYFMLCLNFLSLEDELKYGNEIVEKIFSHQLIERVSLLQEKYAMPASKDERNLLDTIQKTLMSVNKVVQIFESRREQTVKPADIVSIEEFYDDDIVVFEMSTQQAMEMHEKKERAIVIELYVQGTLNTFPAWVTWFDQDLKKWCYYFFVELAQHCDKAEKACYTTPFDKIIFDIVSTIYREFQDMFSIEFLTGVLFKLVSDVLQAYGERENSLLIKVSKHFQFQHFSNAVSVGDQYFESERLVELSEIKEALLPDEQKYQDDFPSDTLAFEVWLKFENKCKSIRKIAEKFPSLFKLYHLGICCGNYYEILYQSKLEKNIARGVSEINARIPVKYDYNSFVLGVHYGLCHALAFDVLDDLAASSFDAKILQCFQLHYFAAAYGCNDIDSVMLEELYREIIKLAEKVVQFQEFKSLFEEMECWDLLMGALQQWGAAQVKHDQIASQNSVSTIIPSGAVFEGRDVFFHSKQSGSQSTSIVFEAWQTSLTTRSST